MSDVNHPARKNLADHFARTADADMSSQPDDAFFSPPPNALVESNLRDKATMSARNKILHRLCVFLFFP